MHTKFIVLKVRTNNDVIIEHKGSKRECIHYAKKHKKNLSDGELHLLVDQRRMNKLFRLNYEENDTDDIF